jgi:hypothetical protein
VLLAHQGKEILVVIQLMVVQVVVVVHLPLEQQEQRVWVVLVALAHLPLYRVHP